MASDRSNASVNSWNAEYLDDLYHRFLADPDSIDQQWRQFFLGFDLGVRSTTAIDVESGEAVGAVDAEEPIDLAHTRQGRVDSLVYHYRDIGHLAATLDPLETVRDFPEQLTLGSFELTDDDLAGRFDPGVLPLENPAALSEILGLLEDTYCRTVGAEYMHIPDRDQRRWLQKRMETVRNHPVFEPEHRLRILQTLMETDALERFLDVRYQGKKWFSLSGAESLIVILKETVDNGPRLGVEEFTLGMTHRGRVNVLVNIFGKSYEELFTEFHESWDEDYLEGGGDVKYHRGYSADHTTTSGNTLRLTIANNPSHLEFVYPVVLGRCRAKQRLHNNEEERDKVVPIMVHGDGSFPGQGIVAECLNLAHLDGYRVGGMLHVIVNNQIGFTTNPIDSRSGVYPSDLAKMINAPIFHVNGDDPEACAFVARLAMEYRQTFKNDVVIDLWCYRKYGHNESDEPAYTQPLMYEKIRQKTPVPDTYAARLIESGVLTAGEHARLRDDLKTTLDTAQTRSRQTPVDPTVDPFAALWKGLEDEYVDEPVDTRVSKATLKKIATALGSVPDGFTPHKRIQKNILDRRGKAITGGKPFDWGTAEMLAYGSLLLDGHAVRLTGQDVERGTFSHRHAVAMDMKTGNGHIGINHIQENQANFCVHNSPLSEQSCVGFEYGYSLTDPKMLIVWEAQFGDFVNGAQVIIDQFIASAEHKWQRHTGIVMLLPHGYEGQGPEHSSARLERFLQLCANDNMQVINPTTPAQIFHALRNQIKRSFRTPLIVMSPKSLLRHPQATSRVKDLTDGGFQRVIDDETVKDPAAIDRILLCTGKFYYDLLEARGRYQREDVAIVRVEQLHPLPIEPLQSAVDRYENASEFFWAQEEPRNAGAYRYMEAALFEHLDLQVEYAGRDDSGTPAVGSFKIHALQQEGILAEAFAETVEEEEDTDVEAEPEEVTA